MKKFKKLIPAVCMLLLATMLMGTTTYAWFSMNTTVTVTGMTVRTTVGDNLLIAHATDSGAATMPETSAYRQQETTPVAGKLEPVSSVNGQNGSFYYTSVANVDAVGDAASDTYVLYNEDTDLANNGAGKSRYDDEFNSNYGVDTPSLGTAVYGYIDYVFALQATNTQAENNRYLNMTVCNLTYNGTDSVQKAFRVAVLLQECSAPSTASTTVNTVTVLAPESAAYFEGGNKAVSAVDAAPSTAVTNFNRAANIATVSAGETKYYKVTVRLWLEGEDTTCNSSTFATLTNEWDLDLKFALEDATGGVTVLGRPTATQYTIASFATNVSASNKVFSGTTYYAYSATTPADTTIYGDVATGASNVTRWFTISGNDVYEITEFVTKS